MWHISAFVVLFVVIPTNSVDPPTVRTSYGLIRGLWTKSAHDVLIANFLGIPYALPPLGDLRFRSPKPWNQMWIQTRNATEDGPMCPQFDNFETEDCLYLNVFVPYKNNTDVDEEVSVLIYVHGGSFNSGNNNSTLYSPLYLLDYNIILVTVNYRLNVFGFLSTGNEASPGNNGLKDIIMALKWVQRNIGYFGGNPEKVTLWGHSAGAAAVHLLALSKKSEGLFQQVITHSGSALAPWAYHSRQDIRNTSLQLANILGCYNQTNEETNNRQWDSVEDKEIVECLRNVSIKEIIKVSDFYEDANGNPACKFGPTLEAEGEDAIITMHPMEVIRRKMYRDIPWIDGYTTDEGLVKTIYIKADEAKINLNLTDWEKTLPSYLEYQEIALDATKLAQVVKEFYCESLNQTACLIVNGTTIMSDALFYWPSYKFRNEQKMKSNLFYYMSGYQGTYSTTFKVSMKKYGVSHSDDMNYLFPILNVAFEDKALHNSESDKTMINIMCEMWTNFVKTGKPSAVMIPEWEPIQKKLGFMRFGNGSDLSVSMSYDDTIEKRMQLWEEVAKDIFNSNMEIIVSDNKTDDGKNSKNNGAPCVFLTNSNVIFIHILLYFYVIHKINR